MVDMPWQPSLLDVSGVAFDASFSELQRIDLDPDSWIEYQPAWVSGSDDLFAEILESRDWGQRSRRMYDNTVLEPRLTAPWRAESNEPLEPSILEDMRVALSERYGVEFDSVGFNLYRDGQDSVAWHGDRIRKEIEEPIVVLVSLGQPRKFLLRRAGGGAKEGGPSKSFLLGRGDLLTTGGKTQRAWDHSVPKVARAGPRISLAFRHGMDPAAYAGKKLVEPE
jgi:alkylated DNA repair dioxygenase AlkB